MVFSIFFCLLDEVVNYLFYSKRPPKLTDGSILNIFPHNTQGKNRRARKETPAQVFSMNFAEILRAPPVAASEDENNEIKLLHMASRLSKCYL